ncbi:MAG: hypothetical protein ABI868_19740 [Acidobacteriota bacterium]
MTIAILAVCAGGATAVAGQPPPPAALSRTTEGRPDLSGFWQVSNTAVWDIQDHRAQKGIPAEQGVVAGNEIPYQPWAAEKRQENFRTRTSADPEAKCYLPGVPRLTYMPFPFQIIQTPREVILLHEYVHAVRTIHADGTPHSADASESWLGDSRGRWEGDTLVVDSTHFNDRTWFDRAGNFHSNALHVVERFTVTGPDHIDYSVLIEDPKVFTRPWTMSMILYRHKEKNFQLLEYECYGFDHEKTYP